MIPPVRCWSCQLVVPALDTNVATTSEPSIGPRVQKPIAEARPSWAEKSLHERRGGHEDDPLDEPDRNVDHREGELGVGAGQPEQAQQPDDPPVPTVTMLARP